jgi:oligopeptide transport system substrate-binding protein
MGGGGVKRNLLNGPEPFQQLGFASFSRLRRGSVPMVPRPLFVFAGVLALSGCARHETAVAEGNRDQVLHMGNKDEPVDLDPQINTAISTGTILQALFQGLVELGNDGQTLLPGAAEHWEVSQDGLRYVFHLRENGRWSNGAPLTAGDFRDSLLRLLDPQVGCENAGYAFPITGARDFLMGRTTDPGSVGVRAPDAHTLVIVLDHPAAYLLRFMARDPFYPVYMPSLDANGGRRQRGGPWTRPGVLVSNGPFSLAEWRSNAFIRVRANPFFWDAGRVRLREVRFYPTDDEGAEERSFRTGQLHITCRVPKSKLPAYDAGHPGELHLLRTLRTNFLTFNVARAPFADSRVRRAFSLAVDREKLVHAALGKLGSPAFSFVRPGTGGFTPADGFGFNPGGAARLLAEAGYPGGRGLPPVELTLNGNTGTTLAVAEVLQQMWAENLGVRAAVRPLEFKAYLTTERERQFQVLLEGYSYIPDPRDLLAGVTTGDPDNDSGASDASIDAAFAASEQTADEAARRAAFATLEAVNAREVYYAPIYYANQGLLISPAVRGWRDNGNSIIDWRELHLEP